MVEIVTSIQVIQAETNNARALAVAAEHHVNKVMSWDDLQKVYDNCSVTQPFESLSVIKSTIKNQQNICRILPNDTHAQTRLDSLKKAEKVVQIMHENRNSLDRANELCKSVVIGQANSKVRARY